MWAEKQNLLPVQITSAVELDSETTKNIGKRIEDQTGRKVELSTAVDPEVLGGLVIRVGNMVMDTSVRSRLERVRREVLRAA
jgi:ATP synthase F1 delta subunit